MAHLVRALHSGLCRADRPGFEPRSDHQVLISTPEVLKTITGDGRKKMRKVGQLCTKNIIK